MHVHKLFILLQNDVQALHIVCQWGFTSCVKVLIEECHADPNCKAEVMLVLHFNAVCILFCSIMYVSIYQ